MKARLLWLALLAFAWATGMMAWLTPSVHGDHSRKPATIRSVSPSGADSGDCSGSPCLTIQYAIYQSSYGDSINVASGVYTEHITMVNGVSVLGAGWATTIITGNFYSATPVVTFSWGDIDATTVLSGVKVSGGGNGTPAGMPDGGGISIDHASPTIINTFVYSNTGFHGGGVYVNDGSPTFSNVPAWNNRSVDGAGFYLHGSSVVTITGNPAQADNGTVRLNTATGRGGGFYVGDSVTVTLSGLRISGNSAAFGGGVSIYANTNQITLQSNSIFENTAASNGGGIETNNAPNLQIVNNAILTNTATDHGGGADLGGAGQFLSNTVKGNRSTSNGSGAGLYVGGSASRLTIDGNWFEGNVANLNGFGGGLHISLGAFVLVNANTIVTNTAKSGGGISVSGAGAVTITNNIIARNIVSTTSTGGINIDGGTPFRLINNTIADNDGNGVRSIATDGIIIVNNIIVKNKQYGVDISDAISYTVDYNDIWGNSYVGVITGTHDLSVNPNFIGNGSASHHYHILATSPVSKTGSSAWAPQKDIDGEARVVCYSMGADQLSCVVSRLLLPLILR